MNSPISSSASMSELHIPSQSDTSLEVQLDLERKSSISRLKEFYLRRLSQSETAAVSRLRAKSTTFSSPRRSPRILPRETEWEVAGSKGFSKASETGSSVQTSPSSHPQECTKAVPRKSMADLDAKLETVMAALESRILECLEPNAMRHLKQLRHRIETALRWTTPDVSFIGEETAQQVKQLNGTARVLAPGVYVFSKRAEHLIVQKERYLKKIAKKLIVNEACIGALGGNPLTRLRILSILLNGLHERDPVRYDVYCTQVKVAGKAGLIDQINVSLDQVRSWLNMWEVDGMKARKVYRLLFDALTEDRQSEEATSVMVELLRTYTDENASEVKDDAKNCIVSLLGRPNVLIMDFLLTLPPVAALQGEPIYKLLTIFVSGKLADYMEFYEKNKDFVDSCGLTHEKNLHKMRVLTFMSLGEAKSEVHFDDLCKELNISVDDIEEFIIEALRSKLVRTRIDQVNKKVIISSATHRTFGNNQWQELRNRLEEWRQSLQSVGTSLKAVVPAVDG